MKILHVVPTYKPAYVYGGPIESISKLCEGLSRAGHQVDVFTTTGNGLNELTLEQGIPLDVDGVNVYYFKRQTKDPTNISFGLWRQLYRNIHKYDVVHIQSWWNILVIVAATICYVKGVKYCLSPRGMLSKYVFNSGQATYKRIMHRMIGKKLLKNAVFHATSEPEYKECMELIDKWEGFVEPNILSLPKLEVEKVSNPSFSMIFMSRIHPKKGLEILFRSLKNLEEDFVLNIAGTGDEGYIDELKRLAVNLKIDKKINWLGWLNRDQKFTELMRSDLLVLTSYNENFANVVIESLHVGTPVLISQNVGLSKFVSEQQLGWVTTLDQEELVNSLNKAMVESSRRIWINNNGQRIIDLHFSVNKVIEKYLDKYELIKKLNERPI